MEGFLTSLFAEMESNAELKANVTLLAMALATIPMAGIGQLFKLLPDSVFAPARIPAVLVGLGYLGGHLVHYLFPYVPQDFVVVVLAGAGGGSKFAHDGSKVLLSKMKEGKP